MLQKVTTYSMVQIPLEELVSMKETIARIAERLKTVQNSHMTRTMQRSVVQTSAQPSGQPLVQQ